MCLRFGRLSSTGERLFSFLILYQTFYIIFGIIVYLFSAGKAVMVPKIWLLVCHKSIFDERYNS